MSMRQWILAMVLVCMVVVPIRVVAQPASVSFNKPVVRWEYPQEEEVNIDGFRIYYYEVNDDKNVQKLEVADPAARRAQLPALMAGDWHLYAVAYKGEMESSSSNLIQVFVRVRAPKIYIVAE